MITLTLTEDEARELSQDLQFKIQHYRAIVNDTEAAGLGCKVGRIANRLRVNERVLAKIKQARRARKLIETT